MPIRFPRIGRSGIGRSGTGRAGMGRTVAMGAAGAAAVGAAAYGVSEYGDNIVDGIKGAADTGKKTLVLGAGGGLLAGIAVALRNNPIGWILIATLSVFLIWYFVKNFMLSGFTDMGSATKEGFQTKPANQTLDLAIRNTQALTGRFPAQVASPDDIRNAVEKGVRTFFFEIDYNSSSTQSMPKDTPMLLTRNASGDLEATSRINLQDAAQALATYAFSDLAKYKSDPIILILHIRRTPAGKTRVQKLEQYLSFLSKIAVALSPLRDRHLASTPEGTFTHHAQEERILESPLSAFKNRVIIFCNGETELFKRSSTYKIGDAANLDMWVNVRYFTDGYSDGVDMGDTVENPGGASPGVAFLTDYSKLTALSDEKREQWARTHERNFLIVLPKVNPPDSELGAFLKSTPVNAMPIYESKGAYSAYWSDRSPWKERPSIYKV